MMGTPTAEQRRRSRERARAQRIPVADPVRGLRWVAPVAPDKHGQRWVRSFYACECAPCLACDIRNDPARRAELRRQWLARRVRVAGLWIAVHLPPGKHGTKHASDYYGCECWVCTQAASQREARRKRR